MKTRILTLLLMHIFVSAFCKVNQDTIDGNIVVSKVERKLDISSHLLKTVSSITLTNKGSSAVRHFLFAVDPSLKDNLSFITASIKEHKSDKLAVLETSVSGHSVVDESEQWFQVFTLILHEECEKYDDCFHPTSDKRFFRVALPSPLEGGKTASVDVEAVFSHVLTPYPSAITQAEKQLVVLETNLYFYSPYPTTSQTTTVTTANANVESYTKTKPVSQSDTTINYGPFEDKASFSEAPLRVHEENNSPFLTVTYLERLIEVSHWGNIAVEEHVDIRHTGATLKGPFSRFDYQRQQDGYASVKHFKTSLPASAHDVYYRDEIGNISTSNLRETDESIEVELRPRFPLFGGWKTKYILGYNVPSYEYLFYKGDHYALKVRFIDHIYDDMVVDEVLLKIILPEGSKDIQLKVPFEVERRGDDVHYTYLDTLGRPVVVLHKHNLVEQHIQDFELHYTFQRLRLLQEPLLVVGAFYLLFLAVIIYVRLDFSITKDEAKESRMRVSSLIDEVQSAHDRRSALYQSYDDAINKYKSSKDLTAFTSSRKKIDADYKQLTQQIQNLQSQLKAEGSDGAEKVGELQRLDGLYKEQITLAITAAEKLVSGKLGRAQYLENESSISGKCEDTYKKMESLRSSL